VKGALHLRSTTQNLNGGLCGSAAAGERQSLNAAKLLRLEAAAAQRAAAQARERPRGGAAKMRGLGGLVLALALAVARGDAGEDFPGRELHGGRKWSEWDWGADWRRWPDCECR
jgi:hypothetical protein